jgi:outer membrane protein OmpA-like peptidoglycan-associated protein
MSWARWFLTSLLFIVLVARDAAAGEGPFVGVDLGVSEPTNANYRAHVKTGGGASPFAGYMFNDYIGVQGQIHFVFQEPDNDHRGFENENQTTTLFGATIGPRLSLPLGEFLELYGTGQGGGFGGLSGRLKNAGAGFSLGGGVDVELTPSIAVGAFGRWNHAFMSPKPTLLAGQVPEEQGPADAEWATAGLALRYSFGIAAAPPPPPPPPVPLPPPPPVKKKIVLRSVYFDFNKTEVRPDAVPILDEAGRLLEQEGNVLVVAEGHTDSVGSDAYNLKLSLRRAEAVRAYLVAHGIAASRIRVEGRGEAQPVASNDTADGRAQNRRVELHVP